MSSSNPNATYGPWSSGLFDCFSDAYSCCLTCWCPCISFGQIADILDKGNPPCFLNGALYFAIASLTGCACCYSCCYRTKMRQHYMLEADPCNDFLVHFCCELCALCQEYRELTGRGFNVPLGWEGNMKRQNREVAMAPSVEDGMKR